jgi:hypothetical protein
MSAISGTRREFIKQTSIAAVVTAAGCSGEKPAPAASKKPVGSVDPEFQLQIEMSGLWFLAVSDGKMYALAKSPPTSPDEFTHFPRLFVHRKYGPQAGKPDTEDASYLRYDITKSIEWPKEVQTTTETPVLPESVTNLAALTGHPFDKANLTATDVYSIPLNFGEPDEEFPRTMLKRTRFYYEFKEGMECGDPWKSNKVLAWRLKFYTWVTSPTLKLDLPGGPGELTPHNGVLKLIFRNTIDEYSNAEPPKKDDTTYAGHYVAHYEFLTPGIPAEQKCYPVRMEQREAGVGGMYTCMFGGGGG